MKHVKRMVALAAVALLLTGAVAGTVTTRRPEKARPAIQVVRLRLIADGKELARISTPGGAMATMSRENGEAIGLTPSVQDDGVTLTVAVKDPATGEFKIVGRYPLVRHVPVDVSTERTPLAVEWLETTIATPVAGGVSGAGPCTVCCVICDGITLCACEVTTSCGHCCCKEACGCMEGAA